MDIQSLIQKASEARENAYAPYSGFRVGAALLTSQDEVFTGCNVENISYGATCCAERVAIFKAISEGKKEFKALAIASDLNDMIYPCGICRQVIIEFKIPVIIVSNPQGQYLKYNSQDLLPFAFDTINEGGRDDGE